ncbi:putative quinol monooxygenase [Streptomyces scabiei]|uniref:putative quinol monooxygenase n=1 Tax=Streptomyces scabiei TaxID=1930 RepID=UPI0029BEA7DE|nr:putative quinol monooxygenase [Streptomyces scabiei]MDX3118140.1 putative quinol monooxygenase [Streptomyces scabiei]
MTSTKAPLTVVARMRAKDGREAALHDALTALLAPTRQAPGCLTYELHTEVGEPARFWFYEVWRHPEDHASNLESPHITGFLGQTASLLDGDLEVHFLVQPQGDTGRTSEGRYLEMTRLATPPPHEQPRMV